MDHNLAHETYAAERYLLGEMSSGERDEFEEHYFGCRMCGENVEASTVFVENVKAVFRDESLKASPAAKRGWLRWTWPTWSWLRLPAMVPSLAALVLAAVVTYQNSVVIPQLLTPQSMAAPVILDGETRASSLPRITQGAPLRFEMVLVHATASDHVLVDLVDTAGKTVRSGSVETPSGDHPLDVYFPGRLKPGRYSLVARSAFGADAGQELARNQFEVIGKGE
jgi:methionine-rich copper-binding protein CopC